MYGYFAPYSLSTLEPRLLHDWSPLCPPPYFSHSWCQGRWCVAWTGTHWSSPSLSFALYLGHPLYQKRTAVHRAGTFHRILQFFSSLSHQLIKSSFFLYPGTLPAKRRPAPGPITSVNMRHPADFVVHGLHEGRGLFIEHCAHTWSSNCGLLDTGSTNARSFIQPSRKLLLTCECEAKLRGTWASRPAQSDLG